MTTTHKQFRLTAVAAALVAVFGPALADDEVAALIKPDSSVSIGIGNWSNDRHQQGIYDAMRDDGLYGLVDADIVKRDDATGTWYKVKGQNLGLDNREIKAEYLRQGNVGATIEYNRITRDNPNTFNTSLRGIGTDTLTEGLRTDPQRAVSLGTLREQASVGFFKNLMPGLDFSVNFKNEDKTGTRHWGRGGPNQFPEFAVEPIDSTTRQLETILSYTTKKFQLSGGYNGSWYDNSINQVVMNGVTGVPGLTTYLSVPMDNRAHQLFLNGGYNFTSSTRGTLKMEYAEATQNERLPLTPGTTSATSTLPTAPTHLDGKVVTSLVQLGLNSRITQSLNLNGSLRYHNQDDKTPVATFATTGDSPDYTGFSYQTLTGKLEGTYLVADGYSLVAGVEGKKQDRDLPVTVAGAEKPQVVPMRTELDEVTSRLEVRRSLSETVNGSVAYLHANRTGGAYHVDLSGVGGGFTDIEALINPLNIADRERNKLRLAIDWAPTDALSVQFNVEEGRDKYDFDAGRPFGLSKGTARLYGIDAAYTISDKVRFNAWYSYDQSKAKQSGARAAVTGANAAIKDYDLEDTGNSIGFGLRLEPMARLTFGGDLEWFRNVSKYDQALTAVAGGAVTNLANFTPGLPDIENKVVRLSLFSVYTLNKQSDLRFDFIHERWKTDDWSWQYATGLPFTYGSSAADGTTVTADAKQVSNFIGVRYIYKF